MFSSRCFTAVHTVYTWRCCLGERRAPTEDCLLDEGYEAAPEGATRVAAAGNAFFADVVDLAGQKYFNKFYQICYEGHFQDRLKVRGTQNQRAPHASQQLATLSSQTSKTLQVRKAFLPFYFDSF